MFIKAKDYAKIVFLQIKVYQWAEVGSDIHLKTGKYFALLSIKLRINGISLSLTNYKSLRLVLKSYIMCANVTPVINVLKLLQTPAADPMSGAQICQRKIILK